MACSFTTMRVGRWCMLVTLTWCGAAVAAPLDHGRVLRLLAFTVVALYNELWQPPTMTGDADDGCGSGHNRFHKLTAIMGVHERATKQRSGGASMM